MRRKGRWAAGSASAGVPHAAFACGSSGCNFGFEVRTRATLRNVFEIQNNSPAARRDLSKCHANSHAPCAIQFVILRRVKRPFLSDTDTASDDAVALIMALRSPQIQVEAITTVAGNVDVHQATRNALYTAELCDSNVPVFAGAEQPLRRAHANASWFHGRDGLGDHGYPPPGRAPEKQSAVDAIIDTVESNPGLEMVTLAPLTNIALALQKKPGIAKQVSRCVVMGGAPCCEGNVTPAAEYNIWVDPEAARIVLRSGLLVELVGWQTSRADAVLNEVDIARILGFNNALARFAIECNSHARKAYKVQTGEDGISLPDPVDMSIVMDPTVVTE